MERRAGVGTRPELLGRPGVVAESGQQHPELLPGGRVTRRQFRRPAGVSQGRFELTACREGGRQSVVCPGRVGVQFQGPAVMRSGFFRPAGRLQRGPETDVRPRLVAVERKGRGVVGSRPLVPAGGAVDLGQVVAVGPNGRLERAGVRDQLGRVVELAGVAGDDPQQVPSVRVTGVRGQHPAVDQLRFVQPAGLVVLDGRAHQGLQVRVGRCHA